MISSGESLRKHTLLVGAALFTMAASLLLGGGGTNLWELNELTRQTILRVRLWRWLDGLLVGAALGASGAVLQGVLKNPLAEPYVLGLSSGAALGTALGIVVGITGPLASPLIGFAGALASLWVVMRLAAHHGRTESHTLILAGVVWSSLCASILMFLVSLSKSDNMHALVWWFLGSLEVFDSRLVIVAMAIIVSCLVLLFPFLRAADAMLLGDDVASHLGLNPEQTRRLLLAFASLLTATAVAISGLVAFVGLTVPHTARLWVGPRHRRLVPTAALLGAAFLVLADGIGRTVLYPREIPVGVITAIVGAPFFLWVLRKRSVGVTS